LPSSYQVGKLDSPQKPWFMAVGLGEP